MSEIMKKIKAVMIGHAVGDALGVPVECCEREELDKSPVTDMRGFGSHPVPAGAWSDDTSMSLAALDSLAKGEIDYFEIMQNFAKWIEAGEYTPTGESFDMGRTCLHSIVHFVKKCRLADGTYRLPTDFDVTSCGQTGEYANGNGSLMRIHPFVLYAYARQMPIEEWLEMIAKASALTHNHDRAKIGCLIYTFVLMRLLKDGCKCGIGEGLKEAERYLGACAELAAYERIFRSDFDKLPREEIKSSGYVVDTLEAALWCLLTTDNYCDCVLKAVNLGGDTDTVASVAGGLAGALYGYDSIPAKWKDALIKKDYIEEMCERAGVAWAKIKHESTHKIVDLHMRIVSGCDDDAETV